MTVDQWEWETFSAINYERSKHGVAPLSWCCAIENDTRGSCGGITFDKVGVKKRITEFVCPHWTSPEIVAKGIINTDDRVLQSCYKSGAIVLRNDAIKTTAILAYGKGKPVFWEQLKIEQPCAFGNHNAVYLGHEGCFEHASDRYIELEMWRCKRCGKSWTTPH